MDIDVSYFPSEEFLSFDFVNFLVVDSLGG